MTAASIGLTSKFAIGDGASPEVFTPLAEVTAITPPGISRDMPEATHMQSPEGWREFIMGLKDGGEVSLELNFINQASPTGNAAVLMAEFDKTTTGNYQIEFPDTSTWSFTGGCTGFEPDAPLDDRMTASATFKITGKPVLAQV